MLVIGFLGGTGFLERLKRFFTKRSILAIRVKKSAVPDSIVPHGWPFLIGQF